MNVEIVRHAYLPDVTLGTLTVEGAGRFYTLEEPWIANAKGLGGQRRADGRESCVPDGDYVLKAHNGERFKQVWRLSNPLLGVFDMPDELESPDWGRAAVLIHAANTTDDILGCIAVGLAQDFIDNRAHVLDSRNAIAQLRAILGHVETHRLTIRPTGGTA